MNIDRMERTAVIIIGDLSLLASLYLAHFIVWHTLRTRRKARLARLKSLKLISGRGQELGGKQALRPVDEKAKLREVLRASGFRNRA